MRSGGGARFGDLAPGRKSSLALRAADLSGDGPGKGNVEEVGIITGVAFSDDPPCLPAQSR